MSTKRANEIRESAETEFDTPEARENLESIFPNLRKSGYQITSERDDSRNCIAYAVGDLKRRWAGRSCAALKGYYWPPESKKGTGMNELVYAYESIGYVSCGKDSSVEAGYTKVAIYMDDAGGWSHASVQLEDGTWSSKIGEFLEDIRHGSPDAFHGAYGYGFVYCYMKKLKESEFTESEAYE